MGDSGLMICQKRDGLPETVPQSVLITVFKKDILESGSWVPYCHASRDDNDSILLACAITHILLKRSNRD